MIRALQVQLVLPARLVLLGWETLEQPARQALQAPQAPLAT